MKLPSFPRLLLIFLDIVAISVLVHLNRIGVIGGLGYLIGLLGTATLFAFLVKLAGEDEVNAKRRRLIKFLVFGLIGGGIMMYGYDVLNRQGSIGVVWILVGAAVAYIGVHEDLMEKTKQEMAERERRRE